MYLITDDEFEALKQKFTSAFTDAIQNRKTLNAKEAQLMCQLMTMAEEEFANHGCNDLPEDFWKGWTKEERVALYKEYEQWNSGGKDYVEGWDISMDWMAMCWMTVKLAKSYGVRYDIKDIKR